MDQEIQVSPAVETQIPAPEPVQPEVTTPEPETTEAPQPEPDEGDKTVKRMERRIQRLTADKYQTRAQAEAAMQEAEQLRQRLAQYEQTQEQPQGPDPIALAKEIAKIEKVTEKSNAVAKEGAKRFPDFKESLQTITREAGPLFDKFGRPTGLGEAVLDADDPAAVLHKIGSDPDLAAELADLSPIQQARRIAKLEAAMVAPKPEPKSNAPKPLTPVKATKADAGGLDDSLDLNEWTKRFYESRRNR